MKNKKIIYLFIFSIILPVIFFWVGLKYYETVVFKDHIISIRAKYHNSLSNKDILPDSVKKNILVLLEPNYYENDLLDYYFNKKQSNSNFKNLPNILSYVSTKLRNEFGVFKNSHTKNILFFHLKNFIWTYTIQEKFSKDEILKLLLVLPKINNIKGLNNLSQEFFQKKIKDLKQKEIFILLKQSHIIGSAKKSIK